MASIHFKKGKNGKRTYHVVVSFHGKHKWVRAGSLNDAKILKREIESLAEGERFEKLGLAVRDKRVDSFFQQYIEYVTLRTAPNTVKRYRAAVMSNRMTEQLTLDALTHAIDRRQPPVGLLHHSDRGSQYASTNYRKLLREHQMISSMSRKGDCWDNAVMESFFATLKTELIYRERFITREDAKSKIFDYDYSEMFYNCNRRHSSLGYKSPLRFEMMAEPT